MPCFTPDQIIRDGSDGTGNPCGPWRALLLSDTGGLPQFGAFIEILPPGSRSSLCHWHLAEDELVHMLSGEIVLHEGGAETVMRAGDTATFRAGTPVGHYLENSGIQEARYIVIGTRAPRDVITYPDHDRVLHLNRAEQTRRFTDGQGQAATSPYED